MRYLKADTSVKVVIGPFVDVTDGFTPETGITLGTADEAELVKHDNATAVDISARTWAALTNVDGYYHLTLSTSDVDTEGQLSVVVQDDSVCLPVVCHFQVVNANVYDSLFAAATTDYLQVDPVQWNGTAVATPTTAGVPEVELARISGFTVTAAAAVTVNAEVGASATAMDNFEDDYDGTGYNKSASTIGTATVAGSVTGAVGSVTGNVGGNVVGSVASVTGAVGSVTGNVGGNVTGSVGSLGATAKADVNTEVDNALNTAIPGTPTANSINERIAAIDDKLPSGTISDFDEASNNVTLAAATHTGAVIPTVSTLTGHTPQTGDSYARLGAPAGASVSADIATVDTNVDTLVTRITSTLFSGITSLAEWLGLLAGKQTGNATARTEVRATGAGSGTYDETTDSLEAVRDKQTDIETDTQAIETDTQDIQSRLPAALVSGKMDSDAVAIAGNTTAATQLAAAAEEIITGTVDTVVNTHTPTTTEFQADDITEATTDHFKGKIVTFKTGNLGGQATDITGYSLVGGIGQFTVTAMTEAPANNDTFVIT